MKVSVISELTFRISYAIICLKCYTTSVIHHGTRVASQTRRTEHSRDQVISGPSSG